MWDGFYHARIVGKRRKFKATASRHAGHVFIAARVFLRLPRVNNLACSRDAGGRHSLGNPGLAPSI
jgi:hypothetical protein